MPWTPGPGATPGDDVFVGTDAVDDIASGGDGNDQLSGLAGNDTLAGEAGNDTLAGGDGNDALDGGAGNDTLDSGAGNDALNGGLGNDFATGGVGSDTLTVDYSTAATAVNSSALTGSFAAGYSGSVDGGSIDRFTSFTGIEKVAITGGSAADTLRGGLGNDSLTGGGGNDTFRGGGGNDAFVGGDGDDIVIMGPEGGTVGSFAGGAGYDTIDATAVNAVYLVTGQISSIERFILSKFNDTFTGFSTAELFEGRGGRDNINGVGGDDTLLGGDGNDTLFGGLGNDTLRGEVGDDALSDDGAGNDVFDGGVGRDFAYYQIPTAVTVRLSIAGPQNTGSAGMDTLIDIEGIVGSSVGDVLGGGVGNDTLFGENGDDRLEGSLGAQDFLYGGAGSDTVDYSALAGGMSVNLTTNVGTQTSGGSGADGFAQIENAIGSAFVDTLVGEAGVNVLNGLGGNDVLQGLAGADTLIGGAGVDAADYREKTAAVVVTLSGAVNAGVSVGGVIEDTIREIEYVYGGGGGDILSGDASNNFLNGFAGNDVLRGGGGVDLLYGGSGLDTVDYRDKAVAISITLNGVAVVDVTVGGVIEDKIQSLEVIYGGSAADTLTGDAFTNLFRGGGGADQIDGGGGVDSVDFREKAVAVTLVLAGGAAATASVGGVAEDVIRNVEVVYGGSGGDLFVGDGLANQLFGNAGNDTLRGQGGADVLTGGVGADLFVYNSLAESTVATGGRDRIADFVSGTDDIRLALIDANTTAAAPGDQAFVLGALQSGVAGRLQVTANGAGQWLVQGDVNGDGAADFAIDVTGLVAPGAGDFVL